MCTDRIKRTVWDYLRQRDLSVFACWLAPELFAQAAQQAGIALGSGALHGGYLVWLGGGDGLVTNKDHAIDHDMSHQLSWDPPAPPRVCLGAQPRHAAAPVRAPA